MKRAKIVWISIHQIDCHFAKQTKKHIEIKGILWILLLFFSVHPTSLTTNTKWKSDNKQISFHCCCWERAEHFQIIKKKKNEKIDGNVFPTILITEKKNISGSYHRFYSFINLNIFELDSLEIEKKKMKDREWEKEKIRQTCQIHNLNGIFLHSFSLFRLHFNFTWNDNETTSERQHKRIIQTISH